MAKAAPKPKSGATARPEKPRMWKGEGHGIGLKLLLG